MMGLEGRHNRRPLLPREAPDGQPDQPGRQSRADMDDIGRVIQKALPERLNLTQRPEPFAMHWQADMLAAFSLQTVDQPATVRDHN